MAPLTVSAALSRTTDRLEQFEIPSAQTEAEWLVCHILSLGRSQLYLNPDRIVEPAQKAEIDSAIQKRKKRIPLQYILGETEFYSLSFSLTPDVLIPRPETEILVDSVLDCVRTVKNPRILDVGTGSGAIAVSISHSRPDAFVVATDVSQPALRIAKKNAKRNRVSLAMVQANLLSSFAFQPIFDAIVSNPPYIPTPDLDGLQPEVREHEPRLALDGGTSGLACIDSILENAGGLLSPGGWLALEVGDKQAGSVAQKMGNEGSFQNVRTLEDLAQKERIVLGRRVCENV